MKTKRHDPPAAAGLPPPPAPTARDANPWTVSAERANRDARRPVAPAPTPRSSAHRRAGRWVPFAVLLFIAGTAIRVALEAAATGRPEALIGPLVMIAFVVFMAWRLARRRRLDKER